MKFYVQLQEDNRVTDIIEYAYGDYVEVELALPLPLGAYSGEYQLVGNELVHRPDWVQVRDENGSMIAADDIDGQIRYYENLYFETYIKRDLLDAEFGGGTGITPVAMPMSLGLGGDTEQLDNREALKSKIMDLRNKLNEGD